MPNIVLLSNWDNGKFHEVGSSLSVSDEDAQVLVEAGAALIATGDQKFTPVESTPSNLIGSDAQQPNPQAPTPEQVQAELEAAGVNEPANQANDPSQL